MKRLVFDLTKIPFLERLIGISRLIVEVLNDQNRLTELNMANWFSNYVQFCSDQSCVQMVISQNELNQLDSVTKMNRLN